MHHLKGPGKDNRKMQAPIPTDPESRFKVIVRSSDTTWERIMINMHAVLEYFNDGGLDYVG